MARPLERESIGVCVRLAAAHRVLMTLVAKLEGRVLDVENTAQFSAVPGRWWVSTMRNSNNHW